MPTAWLIRHGQSEANAGLRSKSAAGIPLTVLGQQQADALARWWPRAPDRIAHSPYLRAAQTAAATAARFPNAPLESWPVQEFTYLAASRCHDTTSAERVPWVNAYWTKADPDGRDGPDVESFRDFVARVDACIARLRAASGSVAVFCHGQFLQGAMWRLGLGPQPAELSRMREFRAFMLATPVANSAVLEVTLDAAGARFAPLSTAHLGDLSITY